MKQIVLLAIVAFVCAVGGATWFTASLMPPPQRAPVIAAGPITPGTAVPTTVPPKKAKAADTAKKASGKPGTGSAKPTAVAADSTAKPVASKPRPDSGLAARPAPAVDSATLVRGAKSVAKVVASMKPKDAVGILGHLSDDEVERIVRQLNPKQIAALLAAFPQERAAGLSRKLLGPKA
jgi:hypothetical protein